MKRGQQIDKHAWRSIAWLGVLLRCITATQAGMESDPADGPDVGAAVEAMYGELLAGPRGVGEPGGAGPGGPTAAGTPEGAAALDAGIRDLRARHVAYIHQAHHGLGKVRAQQGTTVGFWA